MWKSVFPILIENKLKILSYPCWVWKKWKFYDYYKKKKYVSYCFFAPVSPSINPFKILEIKSVSKMHEIIMKDILYFQCSVTCGRGQQQRNVTCVDDDDNHRPSKECFGKKPRNRRICRMGKCPRWTMSKWTRVSIKFFIYF